MMLTKKAEAHKPSTNKTVPMNKKSFVTRALGVIFLAISVSVFVQGIPLLYVFLGAYLGVPADAKVSNMDTMIWLLTCLTMMILALYAFISWTKFLWRRFIANPRPLVSPFKKKDKHAQ